MPRHDLKYDIEKEEKLFHIPQTNSKIFSWFITRVLLKEEVLDNTYYQYF